MVSYNPVNLKKHKSEALVVHCCDPRFQEAYRQAAEQVSEFYDLMVVPGASKALPSLKVVPHLLGEKKELEIKEPAEDSSRFKLIDRLRQA